MGKTTRPLTAARKAAETAFDDYLARMRAGATLYVPQCVVEAAQAAFVAAGGRDEVEVRGHGNTTHPVCSVSVSVARVR